MTGRVTLFWRSARVRPPRTSLSRARLESRRRSALRRKRGARPLGMRRATSPRRRPRHCCAYRQSSGPAGLLISRAGAASRTGPTASPILLVSSRGGRFGRRWRRLRRFCRRDRRGARARDPRSFRAAVMPLLRDAIEKARRGRAQKRSSAPRCTPYSRGATSTTWARRPRQRAEPSPKICRSSGRISHSCRGSSRDPATSSSRRRSPNQ